MTTKTYYLRADEGFLKKRKELNDWFRAGKRPLNEYEVMRSKPRKISESDLDTVLIEVLEGSDTEMLFKVAYGDRFTTRSGHFLLSELYVHTA